MMRKRLTAVLMIAVLIIPANLFAENEEEYIIIYDEPADDMSEEEIFICAEEGDWQCGEETIIDCSTYDQDFVMTDYEYIDIDLDAYMDAEVIDETESESETETETETEAESEAETETETETEAVTEAETETEIKETETEAAEEAESETEIEETETEAVIETEVEETETEAVTETEVKETEAKETEAEEEELKEATFCYANKDVSVKVKVSETAELPEDVKVRVIRLEEGTQEYEAAKKATIDSLGTDAENCYDFYDVVFMSGDKIIEVPDEDAKITVEFREDGQMVCIEEGAAKDITRK